ncbi:tapasin-related protein-like [Engraulis encrasicolus]|uniref:tapasin-related protein-like n=1 Tax=Engraulis encrasicolus TaxID=184585 RepID=UPI002FD7256B
MQRHVEGEVDSLLCEVRRHNTSVVARWPGHGAQEHDTWFTCTLRHSKGLFVATTFLRHSPSDINAPRPESGIWAPIADRETVSTSAVMIISSSTPTVNVGLVKEQMLNCEFAVDHKSPHITVEWRLQRTGEPTTKLLSYSGHTNKVIGSGDASFKIPLTKRASEGTYICSVYVPPLYGSLGIALQIMEPPHVSLTVSAELSLAVGEEQKVVCEAATYYPLDVRMEWLKESTVPGASRMPEVLKQVQLSSHRRHLHDTYSLSAFFLLKPSLQDSGYRYTCRVEHASLQYPIRKSFTLTVTESDSLLWYAVSIVIVIVILVLLLKKLNAMREAQKRKPY